MFFTFFYLRIVFKKLEETTTHYPLPTKKMSKHYSRKLSNAFTKQSSRENIANDVKIDAGKTNISLHYLGGAHGNLEFEKLFDSRMKRTTFFRYERSMTATPENYAQTRSGDYYENRGEDDYGYFIRGDFFKHFNNFFDESLPNYLWLDFCGTLTEKLEKHIYDILENISLSDFTEVCYVTFFLNPRGCKNSKEIFGGIKDIDDRANTLCKHFKKDMWANISCEVFETYYNGHSPMGVLKFKNMTKTKTKKTVSDYVALANRGFSNKQISVFWKTGIMNIAGFNAQAKRKGLI